MCQWFVLEFYFPEHDLCMSEWVGDALRGRQVWQWCECEYVLIEGNAHRLCLFPSFQTKTQSLTGMYCSSFFFFKPANASHTWCVCVFWFAFQFAQGEWLFDRQYLRGASSPKASTLHPWPRSTGACLQSAISPAKEETHAHTRCYCYAFVFHFEMFFSQMQEYNNPATYSTCINVLTFKTTLYISYWHFLKTGVNTLIRI